MSVKNLILIYLRKSMFVCFYVVFPGIFRKFAFGKAF